MSFDIYFYQGSVRALTYDAFCVFFRDRKNWSLDSDYAQALYHNKQTGVSFVAIFDENDSSHDDADDHPFGAYALFNVNYFRAPFVALEASAEIDAFRDDFRPSFFNPQSNQKGGDDDYSASAVIDSYNRGNGKAYAHIGHRLRQTGDEMPPAAREDLLFKAWKWNFHVKPQLTALSKNAGRDFFVPTVDWIADPELGGRPKAAVVWTDGGRTFIPNFVDRIILASDALLKRRPLLQRIFNQDHRAPTMSSSTIDDIQDLPLKRQQFDQDISYFEIGGNIDQPSKEICDFYFKKRPALPQSLQPLVASELLSAELLARSRTTP